MSLFGRLVGQAQGGGPRADYGGDGGTIIDLSNPEHVEYLRAGGMSSAGVVVSDAGALRIGVAWRCLHIRAGVIGNMPLDLMRRVDDRTRESADDHPMHELVAIRPNSWQTPQEFKRMLGAHLALRGNAYGLKVTAGRRTLEIWPMHPDRVESRQLADMAMAYTYTRKDGTRVPLAQDEVVHMRGLTLDGVTGLGILAHARETIGSSIQAQKGAARMWKQGVIAPGALKTPNKLSDEAFARLQSDLKSKYSGAENAHKWMILEEGLDVADITFSAQDMQFLDSRKFDRSDIAMFFGVPEFLAGVTEKDSNWGTGLAERGKGFLTYTVEDDLTAFEQSLRRDTLTREEARGPNRLYFRFNRSALLRSDDKTRWATHVSAMQWGARSPNEVRALEDENPREGGDIYYPPPNTAGTIDGADSQDPADAQDPPKRNA